MIPGSYANGFAPRDGQPLHQQLWRGCVGAWCPSLGTSGLTLRDWSVASNNGTLTNMTADTGWRLSDGRYALNLDGSNGYVQLSQVPMAANTLWSFTGWFYFRTLAGGASDPCILNSGSSVFLVVGTSSQLGFYDGGAFRSFTGTVSTNRWTHIAFVRRATASCEGYLDGVSLGSLAFTPGDMSGSTQLGTRSDLPSFGIDGFMDSLHLHNRPLSANEVALLASRRGIAYDMIPRRKTSLFVAGASSNRRRRLLLGMM